MHAAKGPPLADRQPRILTSLGGRKHRALDQEISHAGRARNRSRKNHGSHGFLQIKEKRRQSKQSHLSRADSHVSLSVVIRFIREIRGSSLAVSAAKQS
jgi:hypothetical protein